jgi:NAD(P)-dependent dehydrogenase (short-subunit alcohol dehydrogenase family)
MDSGKGIANTNDFFNRIMDANVRGVFFSLKHEIPAILQSGGGAIVNNASVAGLRAIIAGTQIYTASKFAVVGLTRSVALEFAAKGVRVNAVCPAIIETEMTEHLSQNNELRANYGDAPDRPVWAIGRSCSSGALSLLTGSCIHHRSYIACGWRYPRVSSRVDCVSSSLIPFRHHLSEIAQDRLRP